MSSRESELGSIREYLGASDKPVRFADGGQVGDVARYIDPHRLQFFSTNSGHTYAEIVESFLLQLPEWFAANSPTKDWKKLHDDLGVGWDGREVEWLDGPHREQKLIGLGLTRGDVNGRGMTERDLEKLAQKVNEWRQRPSGSVLRLLDLNDPGGRIPNVGPDKLTDFMANVLFFALEEFTVSECERLGANLFLHPIESQHGWNFGTRQYQTNVKAKALKLQNGSDRILVPLAILMRRGDKSISTAGIPFGSLAVGQVFEFDSRRWRKVDGHYAELEIGGHPQLLSESQPVMTVPGASSPPR